MRSVGSLPSLPTSRSGTAEALLLRSFLFSLFRFLVFSSIASPFFFAGVGVGSSCGLMEESSQKVEVSRGWFSSRFSSCGGKNNAGVGFRLGSFSLSLERGGVSSKDLSNSEVVCSGLKFKFFRASDRSFRPR